MSSTVYVAKPDTPRTPQKCLRCGKPILEGEKVISKAQRGSRKYYHYLCYESMFLDV